MTPTAGAPQLLIHPDAAALAEVTAGRLVASLLDAVSLRGRAHLVLTGGGVGIDVLRRLARSPARDAVAWDRVDIWWGDERFVPAADPERNDVQARAALLSGLPLAEARVHPIGSTDTHETPEDAAAAYAGELATAAAEDGAGAAGGPAVPAFDLLLLGIGPEGHTGSVFPESPAAHEASRTVVGVRGCPKPPGLRVTLTLPALSAARQAWLVVAGAEKAGAVAEAFAGAGPLQLPAAGVLARERTLWLVDAEAAGRVRR